MKTLKSKLSFFILFLFLANMAFAQNSATSVTAATISTTQNGAQSANFNWRNPSNVQASDGVYAIDSLYGSGRPTYFLDAQNFGFQSSNSALPNYIPAGVTINGIEVSVKMRKTLDGKVKDDRISLIKAGSALSTNKARSSTLWPSTAASVKFGSSVDLWSSTWTVSDLTNSGFGIRISARARGKVSVQAEIDHIHITVYFNQKYFYSKSTGDLHNTATWGTSTNGSGTAPTDFTSTGQVFFLHNRTTATLTNNFTISGMDSKLVIGNGSSATALTVPSNYILNAPVEVAAASSLTVTNTTAPAILSVADNTTVTYNANGNQTLSDISYYNLTLGGSGTKLVTANTAGLTSINNVLTINAGVTVNNQGNNIGIYGATNGLVNNGIATGSGKYTYSLLDASSSISGTGTYSNLEAFAESSSGPSQSITLSNPVTATSSLTLSCGTFSVGSTSLTMSPGSAINVVDGTLSGSLSSSSGYDVNYLPFYDATSRSTSGELTGTIRDISLQITSGTTLNLAGNMTASRNVTLTSGILDPTNSNYNITAGGNFINNATVTSRNNTVSFTGSSVQTISGSTTQTFYNMIVNNAAGGSVVLSTPVTITNALTLTNGIVTTSSTNSFTMAATASLSGGSASSYINGPMVHTVATTSSTTKVFPIGKANAYRPVTLTVTHTNNTSTTYTAEMFSGAPPSRTKPGYIGNISSVRYYSINRSNSTNLSSATVRLTYGADDNVFSPSNLHILKSNGSSTWVDIGGIVTVAGAITSSSFNSFSDFVLGDDLQNIVTPLKWVSFGAAKKTSSVELNWVTVNEVNTESFVIEKSRDGNMWTAIGMVNSNNKERNSYTFSDNASLSTSLYRIRQNDKDGKYSYSSTVQVSADVAFAGGMSISPNPVTGSSVKVKVSDSELLSGKEVIVKVTDMTGRIVSLYKTVPASVLSLQHGSLQPGIYVVSIQSINKTIKSKLMVN